MPNPIKWILFIGIFGMSFLLYGVQASASGGRALLVISELDERGVKELKPLYQQVEAMAWSVPKNIPSLKKLYAKMSLLQNQDASATGTQEFLLNLLKDPTLNHIDVILGVHGETENVYFYEGPVEIAEWVADFKTRVVQELGADSLQKLGMMYNLSCYGESHIPAFLEMGFKAVVGSRKVNANAEVEYGGALKALARGKNVESAFARSNSDFWLDVADGPLRWLGLQQDNFLKEVDSFKVIGGQSDYTLID